MTEFEYILQHIPSGSHVLDLGCGQGELLSLLKEQKQVTGYGLEIDEQCISVCLEKGIDVIEQNFDKGLDNFADKSFNFTLLTSTLQAARRPDELLSGMLRISERVIVTFPNFAYWRNRFFLLNKGRMPVSKALPYQWYETPNIHLCTVTDFEALCQNKNILIKDKMILGGVLSTFMPNIFGEKGVFLLGEKNES